MPIHRSLLFTALGLLAVPASAQAPQPTPADLLHGRWSGAAPADTAALQRLQSASDDLRSSVEDLAQKKPGPQHDQALERARQALAQTQQALQDLSASAQQAVRPAQASSTPSGSTMGAGPEAPAGSASTGSLLALLPNQPAGGNQLANGCWVRFYDGKNFQGPSLTLVGPVDMPDMAAAGGIWRDWDSAVAGPRATVTTYDQTHFANRTATLRAGQSVPDLQERHLGWHEQVKSARVSCTA